MAKRRAKRKPKRSADEPRGVEVLTIVWMLSVTTTLVCELGAVAARWCSRMAPDNMLLTALSGLLLFAAAVVGLITLVLTPLVAKARRRGPPRGIVVFALAIGIAPLVVMLLRLLN